MRSERHWQSFDGSISRASPLKKVSFANCCELVFTEPLVLHGGVVLSDAVAVNLIDAYPYVGFLQSRKLLVRAFWS